MLRLAGFLGGQRLAHALDAEQGQYSDDRNRHCRDDFRRDGREEVLASLCNVVNELRRIVGDRRNRQSLDGFLQAELHPGPVVHLGQEFLVLALQFNVDARA